MSRRRNGRGRPGIRDFRAGDVAVVSMPELHFAVCVDVRNEIGPSQMNGTFVADDIGERGNAEQIEPRHAIVGSGVFDRCARFDARGARQAVVGNETSVETEDPDFASAQAKEPRELHRCESSGQTQRGRTRPTTDS